MKVIRTIAEMRAFRSQLDCVALVPTMGNLHAGHLALVSAAKQHAEHVIVSIFVNPIQFGPNEDFESYPRTLESDCEKLEALGVDAVFAPNGMEMYPKGQQSVRVVPSAIQNELCGASREGLFNGVTTVVTKLFNIVQPDIACFGEKDYQQLHIIQEMVEELNSPVKIIPVPIMRESSGLALSSRNGYLTTDEKERAIELSKCLQNVKHAIVDNKTTDLRDIEAQAIHELNVLGWQVDYTSIRHQETLSVADQTTTKLVILAAAKLGKTRLLDNLLV